MHVWSEGQTHRVYLHNGLLVCRLWRADMENGVRVADGAANLSAAVRRVLSLGIRPLGVVLDLAPAAVLTAQTTLVSLLASLERASLPVAVVSGRRPDVDEALLKLCRAGAPRQARLVASIAEAEQTLRQGLVSAAWSA